MGYVQSILILGRVMQRWKLRLETHIELNRVEMEALECILKEFTGRYEIVHDNL
jgi:hypothetical protein